MEGIIKMVETAFLWWYAVDSTVSLCNNRVYRLTPPQNYNIQSIVGAPHLAFEGRMGVRWKGGEDGKE